MNESSPPRARKILGIVVAILLTLVVGAFWYRMEQEAAYRAEVSRVRSLIALKDRGVALVENGSYDEAIEIFNKISKDLPEEPLGLQNLAIAQYLKLAGIDQFRDKEIHESLIQSLRETIIRLQHTFPRESVGNALAGRLEEFARNFDAAKTQYLAAYDLSSPSIPTFAYLAVRIVRDYQQQNDPSTALLLQDALQAAPRNAALILTVLQEIAAAQDAKFFEILQQYRDVFDPFTSRTSQVVPGLLDGAEQAARDDDWDTAGIRLRQIGTVLLGEVTYTQDLARLDPHSLEWIRHDFSEELHLKYPDLRAADPRRIDVRFEERTVELPDNGSVLALHSEDFTLDGRRELFYTTEQSLFIVSFAEDGTARLVLETELPFAVSGIRTADLDRDFARNEAPIDEEQQSSFRDTDLDLVLFGEAGLRLYRNDLDETGSRSLAVVPQADGLDALTNVIAVEAVDFDHDGDLDLVVSSSDGVTLWSNRGNWTFENISKYSTLPDAQHTTTHFLSLDIDRNGLIDVALAIPSSPEGLVLVNNLHGQFASKSGTEIDHNLGRGRQICSLDSNRDARWDIASVGEFGTRLSIASSPLAGRRNDRNLSSVPAVGIATWDYDNDGLDDLISWGESGLEIFRGHPLGDPEPQPELNKPFPNNVSAVTIADFDGDGDWDLAVLSEGELKIFTNQGGNRNHWVELVVRAEAQPQNARERCNMHGVGNLIECKTGGFYQARTVRGTSVRFGLGDREQADVVRLFWTNGIPHNLLNPRGDQTIFEQQTLKGSCPFLYTWDGEKFVFHTDCLWAAPIGLQFAQGVLAPFREWEYLKLDGELLQPRGSEYVLQMTEELWEIAYYDSVKLLAIDHPAEIEVYTNEKVGPAEIAEFKVHTVTDKRRPLSVIDQKNRDVTEVATRRDDRFTRSWEDSFNQGLTETHWLELDLGNLPTNARVTLFATGWVFPTDTSLNIAISQNPEKPMPMPPQVHVPDRNGDWITAIEYMGFPGGKTKTIAVDLTGIFPADDHRLRIVTNMEICWDDFFFTVDEPEAEFRLTELELRGADLHYRGFSARVPRGGNNHATFDYSRVSTDPLWPPIGGHFTRYGDVTELLSEADDCSVVMAPGDEMTVRFALPESALPAGWKRDFILYNVGWDKDADFNTVQGQQVEPLPFRGMTRYPYEPEESFPDTPKHRDYLKTYQTRRQNALPFRTQIRDWTPDRPNAN